MHWISKEQLVDFATDTALHNTARAPLNSHHFSFFSVSVFYCEDTLAHVLQKTLWWSGQQGAWHSTQRVTTFRSRSRGQYRQRWRATLANGEIGNEAGAVRPITCMDSRTLLCWIVNVCWLRRCRWVSRRLFPNSNRKMRLRCDLPWFHIGFLTIQIMKAATAATSIMLKKNVIGHRFIFLLLEYVRIIWSILSTPPFVLL